MQVRERSAVARSVEQGLRRHPVDRALLLCAWAPPEVAPAPPRRAALGALNAALLRLREPVWCATRARCRLPALRWATGSRSTWRAPSFSIASRRWRIVELAGLRFRVPCSRDLAAHRRRAGCRGRGAAASSSSAQRPTPGTRDRRKLLAEVEAGCSAAIAADCRSVPAGNACGHGWAAAFDIGGRCCGKRSRPAPARFSPRSTGLARAYGWTEPEILALSPERGAPPIWSSPA